MRKLAWLTALWVFVLMSGVWAQAAQVPSATTVDLTNVTNILLSIVSAAVVAALGVLVPYGLKRLGVANAADYAQTIDAAGTAAAGMAYNYALAHEGGLKNVDVHSAAIAEGVNHMTSTVPEAMAALGLTPTNVSAIVTSRLGVLLAKDATVTAGAPKQIPAVKLIDAPAPANVALPPETPAEPQKETVK
jgi:hypothetical protein